MQCKLIVTSPAFKNNELLPIKHTGFGEDISPAFEFVNLSPEAKTLAIIMDDLDAPLTKELTHWLIWNLPAICSIPENIPYGAIVKDLEGAFQGVAYGKNRYRGPKPPIISRGIHHYRFTVYALDTKLDLLFSADKKLLLKAMEGHILQSGEIIGTYQR